MTSLFFPSANTFPSFNNTTRPISGGISRASWVTISTAVPSRINPRTTSNIPIAPGRSKDVVGSSNTNTSGSCARARATKNRRCSPEDNSPKPRCANRCIFTNRIAFPAFRLSPSENRICRVRPNAPRNPLNTTSSASSSTRNNRALSGITTPTRPRNSSSAQCSSPNNRAIDPSAAATRTSPAIKASKVLFPAPFPPRMARLSPASTHSDKR